MLKVPAIDIAEVGAGGGSIARIDAGGLLRVGPESAGAEPGPACYGRAATQPTVTDANVVLGLSQPALRSPAARSRSTRQLRARRIERHVAAPLGLTVERRRTASATVANANMARAIRAVTVERGRDPRDLALLAFGGGGPVHALRCGARASASRRVLIPPSPGVFTAVGHARGRSRARLRAPVRRARSPRRRPAARALDAAEHAPRRRARARRRGLCGDAACSFACEADLRYAGQASRAYRSRCRSGRSTPSGRAARGLPARLRDDLRLRERASRWSWSTLRLIAHAAPRAQPPRFRARVTVDGRRAARASARARAVLFRRAAAARQRRRCSRATRLEQAPARGPARSSRATTPPSSSRPVRRACCARRASAASRDRETCPATTPSIPSRSPSSRTPSTPSSTRSPTR